jgi:hypothetical protein
LLYFISFNTPSAVKMKTAVSYLRRSPLALMLGFGRKVYFKGNPIEKDAPLERARR